MALDEEVVQMTDSKLFNLGFTAFSVAGSEDLPTATTLVKWGARNSMLHPQFTVGGMTDATALALSKVCRDEGCVPSVLALLFHEACPTVDTKKALDALKPQLERAMILTPDNQPCRVVGPLFRGLGDPDRGLEGEGDYERQLEFVMGLAEHVKQFKRMSVGLEPLNRFESRGPNRLSRAWNMIGLTESTQLGLLLDSFHQTMEESDPLESWMVYGQRAVIFHLSPLGRQQLRVGLAVTKEMIQEGSRHGVPMVMELFGTNTPKGFFELLGVHSQGAKSCEELFLDGKEFIDELFA